jgi:hypothetical protein
MIMKHVSRVLFAGLLTLGTLGSACVVDDDAAVFDEDEARLVSDEVAIEEGVLEDGAESDIVERLVDVRVAKGSAAREAQGDRFVAQAGCSVWVGEIQTYQMAYCSSGATSRCRAKYGPSAWGSGLWSTQWQSCFTTCRVYRSTCPY